MANKLDVKGPLQRETYTKIFLKMKVSQLTLSEIKNKLIGDSKDGKKAYGTVSPQLKTLLLSGYLKPYNPPKGGKTTSEKFYEINWEKLALKFIEFLQETSKRKLFKNFKYAYEKKWTLKKNQRLQELLQFVIKDHWKYFRKTEKSKTIEDLFEKLRIQMIEDKTYQEEEFKNKVHNDPDFAELVDLIREVKIAFSPNFRTSLKKYLNSLK
jgi:hypothetical protein